MRAAVVRAGWYLFLVVVAIGFSKISFLPISDAFTPALGAYIPASLFWLFFGKFLMERRGDASRVFGIRASRFAVILIFGGFALSTIFLIIGQTLGASFSFATALCGVDGVLQLRGVAPECS